MSKANRFKTFFIALLLGFGITAYIAHYDNQLKYQLLLTIQNLFANSFNVSFEGTVVGINFLFPEIRFKNVTVKGFHDEGWQWEAQDFVLKSSWLSLLLYGKIFLDVTIKQMGVDSAVQGTKVALLDHLRKLIEGTADLVLALKHVHIKKGYLNVYDHNKDMCFTTQLSSEAAFFNNRFKATVYLSEGLLSHKNNPLCEHVSAKLQLTLFDFDHPVFNIKTEGTSEVSQLDQSHNRCHFFGHWQGPSGQFALYNEDKSFGIHSLDILNTTEGIFMAGKGAVPLNYINSRFSSLGSFIDVQGNVGFSLRGRYKPDKTEIEGTVIVDDLGIKNVSFGSCKTIFVKKDALWEGIISPIDDSSSIKGLWLWDEQKQYGTAHVENSSLVSIWPTTYWNIISGEGKLDATFDNNNITALFITKAINQKLDKEAHISGTLHIRNKYFALSGLIDQREFCINGQLSPQLYINSCTYTDENKKPLLDITGNKTDHYTFQGALYYPLFKPWLADFFHYDALGEGTLKVQGMVTPTSISADLDLMNANIQIPQTYNFLRTFKAHINADKRTKKVCISQLQTNLDKGEISCKQVIIRTDDSYTVQFIHAPFIIKNMMLNIEKDLFADLSGNVLLSQRPNMVPLIKGQLIIDRAHMKRNIFSQQVQQKMIQTFGYSTGIYNADSNFDLTIATKNPIRVKTSFLETEAKLSLSLKGTMHSPQVSGIIDLDGGRLLFPYRSLTITNGRIYFLPHQWYDPIVELTAKGTIRKYHVTMHVSGSAQQPNITFYSTPPLSEEQIITLLLAGSEEGSFTLVMPSLIMHNLKNVLFGPELSESKLEQYFKNLLATFRHVRIIPKFTDQKARGGIRAKFEVDVNDQLRGFIQKNFSLPEDTKLEVEYLLSDDISIRGIRDERGDLGGEVEVRWKF